MLHESGTGGAPKYGVVSQMPVVGNVDNPLSEAMNDTRLGEDVTEVGYYKAKLGSGTVLEMAASKKAGLYQYTFPDTDDARNILVDVSHVLSSYRGQGLEQHFLGGNISVSEQGKSGSLQYKGSGTYDGVCCQGLLGTWRMLTNDLGLESSCSLDSLLLWLFRCAVVLQDVLGHRFHLGQVRGLLWQGSH